MKDIYLFLCQILRPDPSDPREKGFTLLELMIVMLLITLIMGLSTIFFANTFSSSKFNTTIRDISSTIRNSRSLAQIHGERKTVTIDLDSKKFWIEGKKIKEIPPDIQIKIIDPLAGEIFEGRYQIVSNALGGIEGGTIVLWNDRRTVSIQPDPIVGSVVVK
jgi:general secretion pathway protein H